VGVTIIFCYQAKLGGAMGINLYCTPRFLNHLQRYNGVQEIVVKRIAEIARRSFADPNKWHFQEEKLKDKSYAGINAFKTAITSSDRLIFVLEGSTLIFTDVGDHDVMDEYSTLSTAARNLDIKEKKTLPEWLKKRVENQIALKSKARFQPKNIIMDLSDLLKSQITDKNERWKYEEELSPAWLTFLDREQALVSKNIFEKISVANNEMPIEFILGGPGTGKSIILLNLAINLTNAGRAVSFQLADQVLKYLNTGNQRVPGANLGVGTGVVLLVDDPKSAKDLAKTIRQARSAKCRAVIVALDPLQWHERTMAEKFEKIRVECNPTFHSLWTCYRQSYGVGKKAVELTEKIFTASSQYLDLSKQEIAKINLEPYINLSLDMEYVDESGRYIVFENASKNNLNDEIERFRRRYDRWVHTHPICIVYEETISSEIRKYVKKLSENLNRKEIDMMQYPNIRGIEFQELFLLVSKNFWEALNAGRQGLGSEDWKRITCMHTILSRPKDSIDIFVFNQ
jgi:DNA replication protein DnaC